MMDSLIFIGLLESRGIKVVEIDCPESFDGLSGMAGNAFVIVINKAFQSERKNALPLFMSLAT